MSLIGDLLWIVFGGGFVIWLEYTVAGLLLCLTVVGIPFGMQCFKIARLGLFPFGKDIESLRGGAPLGLTRLVLNVIWFLFAGMWIFASHIAAACVCAVTIIGIPFAVQHLKLSLLALAPFGRVAKT